jgi:hypothetical protein
MLGDEAEKTPCLQRLASTEAGCNPLRVPVGNVSIWQKAKNAGKSAGAAD